MSDPQLSIIVPCYNECENLRRGVLEEMQDYLAKQDMTYEVIISDDGSTDDSAELVLEHTSNKPLFRVLQNEHGGKPIAVWHGIQSARGELILFTDMDQSTPLDQWDKLRPFFDQGYDVAIGSRGMERKNFALYRRIGSALFRTFRRLFLLRTISDTQCGFKAMRHQVAMDIFPRLEAVRHPGRITGWKVTAFDVELLYLAERSGYRIGEAVVEWANRDVSRGKKKSYLAESKEMAQQVLRIKINERRGMYNN